MIRLFTLNDIDSLISNLKLNVPQYFAESEIDEFIDYLKQHATHYYVFVDQDQIIGSGGINYFMEDNVARISWDIIHPLHQGKGIGKQLVRHRIAEIRKHKMVNYIIVRTSQLVFPFYQKLGFHLEFIEKDYWAKGFDLYYMQMEVQIS